MQGPAAGDRNGVVSGQTVGWDDGVRWHTPAGADVALLGAPAGDRSGSGAPVAMPAALGVLQPIVDALAVRAAGALVGIALSLDQPPGWARLVG